MLVIKKKNRQEIKWWWRYQGLVKVRVTVWPMRRKYKLKSWLSWSLFWTFSFLRSFLSSLTLFTSVRFPLLCIRPRRRNEKLVMLADQLFKDFVEVGILSITALGLLTLLVFLLRYDVCAFLVLQHSIVCKIWQPCTQVNIDISFFCTCLHFLPKKPLL